MVGPISIASTGGDAGLTELVGVQKSGAAVQINLYSKTNKKAAPLAASATPAPVGSAVDLWDYSIESESKAAADIPLDTSTLVRYMASAVTATTTTISWDPAEAPGPFEVYRDEIKVATITGSSFTDKGLLPSREYRYRIGLPAALNPDPNVQQLDFSVQLPMQTLDTQTAAAPRSGRAAEAKQLAASAVAATYNSPTEFVYGTFIPNARIGGVEVAACTLHPGDEFTGDNRGYRMPDGSDGYRTAMWAGVNWGTNRITLNKWVNPSNLVRNGKVIASQKASTSEMYFSPRMSSSVATVGFDHRSGNPHCAIGAITYNVVVTFWRNGLVDITGYRYPVPNHEGWVRWTQKGYQWYNAFKYNNEGFICLTGICGTRSVNAAVRP